MSETKKRQLRTFPNLAAKDFQHPHDAAATETLKAVPGLDTVIASFRCSTHSRSALHAMSSCGRRLPSLGEEYFGVFGKRGEFQPHARYLGVQGLTGDHLGVDVREWCMPRWLQGEPDIGIGCDLSLNRGLSAVRTGQTEQGARCGCLRDHFTIDEKTGHG